MLTKKRVLLPPSMISLALFMTARMSGSLCSLSCRTLSSSSGSGLSTVMSKSRRVSCFLTVSSLPTPERNPATSSMLPTVADSPILWYSPASMESLSMATESWAPLSVSESSWISSMTSHLTLFRCCTRRLPVNRTWRVSGVVMRICGGWRDWRFLSAWGVSPCLTPTLMPRSSPYCSILRSMSLLRALRGVT